MAIMSLSIPARSQKVPSPTPAAKPVSYPCGLNLHCISLTFLWLEWKSASCHYRDALSLSVRALFYLWVRSDVTVSLYLIQGHSRTGHWDACPHCIVGLSSPRRAERKQFVSALLHTDTGGYWPGTPGAISLQNNHILAEVWLIHCLGVKKLVKMVNFYVTQVNWSENVIFPILTSPSHHFFFCLSFCQILSAFPPAEM